MSNEAIAKQLKRIAGNLWDVQKDIIRKAREENKYKEASLKLVHEYNSLTGEDNVFFRCNITIARPNERPQCESSTYGVEGIMEYDPEIINDIIRELLQAVNQRIDMVVMGGLDIQDEDINGLFKQYWRSAMDSMGVEGFNVSLVTVLGSIHKVTVTVS